MTSGIPLKACDTKLHILFFSEIGNCRTNVSFMTARHMYADVYTCICLYMYIFIRVAYM